MSTAPIPQLTGHERRRAMTTPPPHKTSPLTPRIPVDRAEPWKLLPARLFLHAGVFAGVLLEMLDLDNRGGPLDGMSTWVYLVWLGAGLGAGPLIAAAYVMLRWRPGKIRYVALRLQSIANLFALWVLAEYLYSQWVKNPTLYRSQSLLAWCVVAAMVLFFAAVVFNDLARTKVIEHRAAVLEARERE